MALELVSDNWASWPPASSPAGVASPRISFSRDLDSPTFDHHHYHHHRSDASLLDSASSPEFHFCVSRDPPDQDSSIADELFSDGFLLPLPLLPPRGGPIAAPPSHPNPTLATPTPTPPTTTTTTTTGRRPDPASPPAPTHDGKDGAKETAAEPDEKPVVGKQPSSFWRFGRSSSLNCSGGGGGGGGGGARMASLICSLPLLSRSKSTGSNPSPSSTLKPRHHPPFATATIAGSGSKLSRKGSGNGGAAARNPYYYGHHHHGGGGVRISPVLNVPPPYLPKGGGAGLLGLRHLLCNGRDRSRKKAPPPTSP